MDTALYISLATLLITAITLFITLHDKLSRGKCKIKSEAAMLSKDGDRWRVYIRLNLYTKNKPVTIRSVSLSKLHGNRRFGITQFEKAYTGDAFAQAKNEYLLPNKMIQANTYHRLILETKFMPNVELPERYDWDEKGWIVSFTYNSGSVIRTKLKMRIVGKDKFLKEAEDFSTETKE